MNLKHSTNFKVSCILTKLIASLLSVLLLTSFDMPADTKQQSCQVYTVLDTDKHLIALTFDDGPDPERTPLILDILKEFDVRATFFVVGENAAANEELIDRMITEGHEVGNHTFGHKYLGGISRSIVEREIDLCDDVIYNHSEYNTILFRPPGGLYDATLRDVCAERGYSMVLWSIDTRDWTGVSSSFIENEVMTFVEDGSIILMHDNVYGESHTAEALKSFIPKLKKLGYGFVTVSELIAE